MALGFSRWIAGPLQRFVEFNREIEHGMAEMRGETKPGARQGSGGRSTASLSESQSPPAGGSGQRALFPAGSRGRLSLGGGWIGRLKARPPVGSGTLATLALLLAMILWGSVFVGTEQLLEDTGAFTLAAGRFAIGLAVLLPLAYREGFKARFVLNETYLLFGLTGVFLSYGLQNVALQFTSASSAALIVAGMPAAIALMGVLFLRERLPLLRLVGIIVSVAGVVLVSSAVSSGGGSGMLLGNALMVGSVLAYGVYAAQGRVLLTGNHPAAVVTAASFGAGLLFLLIPAAGEMYLYELPTMGEQELFLLLYLGVGTTAATIFLWNYALRFI